jgi:hypothetical protein
LDYLKAVHVLVRRPHSGGSGYIKLLANALFDVTL